MKRIHLLWIALVFTIVGNAGELKQFGANLEGADEQTFKTKYVFVLVIDGPRYSETFGDETHQYIPHLWNDLMPQGTFIKEFRNEGPTFTVPGHAAICTGVYQRLSNDGRTLPKEPSMFQYYLKEKNRHRTKAWVISPKGKLNVLANTSDKDWNNQFMPYAATGLRASGYGYTYDREAWKDVVRVFNTHHPELVLINLLEVDVMGHANRWEDYLQGIRNTDEYAYKLWNMIQSDSIYKDKTSLFITNDHGRHLDGKKDGFVSHGDGCEGCRKISMLCLGPDFKQGIIDATYEQIDIAPTIAKMMGFTIPTADGVVMEKIFK